MIKEKYLEKLELLTQKLGYPSISALIDALARQEVSFVKLVNTMKE